MPRLRHRVLFALLVLVLGIALDRTDVLARDTEKTWEVGGYALVGRYSASSNIDNGFGFGARGGYHFKATQVLEGSFDRASADNVDLKSVKYDINKLSFDFLRIFLVKGHEKMIPFASFGVGMINVDSGGDSTTSTAYRAGGGFKFFFKPRVGFRFDLKIYRWHGDGTVVPHDSFFSMDATFGATFLLGAPK
jgi:outer membrane protein with beta-barrel domain